MARLFVFFIILVSSTSSFAQPPSALPPSVTTVGATASSLSRFNNLTSFPPETMAVVDTFRTSVNWMSRMHQVHGRFLPGINPALAMKLDQDPDEAQAMASWAMAVAARMNGEPGTLAKASQTVLALAATAKTPNAATAAALSLALRDLPGADARMLTAADQLAAGLRTAANAEGMLECDGPTAAVIVQAVARCNADWKTEWLVRVGKYYRTTAKAKPNAVMLGCLLSGLVEGYLATKDPTIAATVFELADAVVTAQVGVSSGQYPRAWMGAVMVANTEPSYEMACVAYGLASATRLIKQSTTDFTRFASYKKATLATLSFASSLQYTDENTMHFEAKFRNQFLVGGTRQSVTTGTLRLDATAWQVLGAGRFLESGAEGRE